MSLMELIHHRRTIRRFKPTPIRSEHLTTIVDAGRMAPSGANLQPLEYIIVDTDPERGSLFELTAWAGYLPKTIGPPPEGKRPAAYIVTLINRSIRKTGGEHDAGAAIENMILSALAYDIGTCWIGSVQRPAVKTLFGIPQHYDVDSVLALGYPDEYPVSEPMSDSIKYYLDDQNVLHVPKRPLNAIVHHNHFAPKSNE